MQLDFGLIQCKRPAGGVSAGAQQAVRRLALALTDRRMSEGAGVDRITLRKKLQQRRR